MCSSETASIGEFVSALDWRNATQALHAPELTPQRE